MLEPRNESGRPSTNFLGLDFDQLDLTGVLRQLETAEWRTGFTYLVTPNVDHMVRLTGPEGRGDEILWDAYRRSTWCVCDSRVLTRVASFKGASLPVAPGSDLTARLFEQVIGPGDRIAIVGSQRCAVKRLQQRYPGVVFVQHIPPMGMRTKAAAMQEAAEFVASSDARFIFLAVGSPQQELLAAQVARLSHARGVALCIGAAIDFVVGLDRRAPVALQRLGLEWAHRLFTNPARLWRRYLVQGPRIFWRAALWKK